MSREAINLTGQRFGRLVVQKREGNYGKHAAWLCMCDCGNTVVQPSGALRSGNSQSCGCLRSDVARDLMLKMHAADESAGPVA